MKASTGYPDDGWSPEGFASPDGRWFSCRYGDHEYLAEEIIKHNWKEFNFQNEVKYSKIHGDVDHKEVKDDHSAAVWSMFHDCKTFLIEECGWVSIWHEVFYGFAYHLLAPEDVYCEIKKLPKKQKDCLWNIIQKYNIEVEDSYLLI